MYLVFRLSIDDGIVRLKFLSSARNLLIVFSRLLPETLRVIVGDGRIIPSATYRPIIPIIGRKRVSEADLAPIVRPRAGPPRNPLKLLMNADILLLLILNAIVCAIYYGFIASLSTLFTNAYPFLNSTTIGLCYLGIGGGMTIGSWASGRYLDWEYRRVSKTHSLEEKDSVDLYSFPFEQVGYAPTTFQFSLITEWIGTTAHVARTHCDSYGLLRGVWLVYPTTD